MEQINQVLQSLSPYVVVTLLGDPIKSIYAAMWGVRSPMPTVWINKYNYESDTKQVIANIWDLPLNKKSIMTPDYTIIFVDYTYRRLSSSEKLFNLADIIDKDKKDCQTVVLIGQSSSLTEDERLCRSIGVHYLNVKDKDDIPYLVRDKCLDIYRMRCHRVDKSLTELLTLNTLKSTPN